MSLLDYAARLLRGGLGNLCAYLAAHVLLCLVPAFFIAGATTALIPKESVTRFLGRGAPKLVSYPAAALAASMLAVCSCTIVPLFAGIHKKGAGLGPAITFLFFAPAANILALVYTGGVIGPDLAFARLFLSLAFGIGIGLVMAILFARDDRKHDQAADKMFAGGRGKPIGRTVLTFQLVLVALMLVGTLKLVFLTSAYARLTLPLPGMERFQAALDSLIPHDFAKGEEGVTIQGVLLIAMLVPIGVAAWKGLENIHSGTSRWTWAALGLVATTLLLAAVGMRATPMGLQLSVTGRSFGVLFSLVTVWVLGRKLSAEELRDFLWESWRFVKQIIPLLLVGVFAVGILRVIIKPEWIETLAGRNSLLGNLAGVTFGVFMYFPTLVEVPIAKTFLSLGMHRGPLLGYLMADPELSLQSMLIVSAIIGRLKTWTYVGLVALFSTIAGLLYGAWVDGMSLWLVALYIVAFVGFLAIALLLARKRSLASPAVGTSTNADRMKPPTSDASKQNAEHP
jgi:uncharacterized membrane protein YraQ (UPF0718 family)